MVWILPIFFIFCQFLLFFGHKRAKKGQNQKKFICSIFFFWEASTYQISENFIEQFGFSHFFLFFFLAVFWLKNGQKMPKSKKSFLYHFFVGNHLHTKFQKILSNSLDFANFLHFWSILAVFWLKKGQKRPKSKKKFFVAFFCWEASTYQISEIFHQTVWILPIFFIFVSFGCFLGKNGQKRPKSKKSFL